MSDVPTSCLGLVSAGKVTDSVSGVEGLELQRLVPIPGITKATPAPIL